ncbi:sulfatase [Sulfuritalea hydrogenivorans sk43H]|uniref:Sulfatase n=1 Tax=Sulfuritalea hydrogenivorans sk43H TaxID=1223802 RepID=W0SF47_9PROT|nr:sulfatase [Sulfuritalea hydrogenivorans sk43H]
MRAGNSIAEGSHRMGRSKINPDKLICAALVSLGMAGAANAQEVLPRPDTAFKGKIGVTRLDSTPAWQAFPEPKKDAPNVLLVLLDDVGFGATSLFGGLARMPKLEQLAAEGVRYNNFHTTGVCSPTRAALLTGRNHHQVGWGRLQEHPAGFPGYTTLWKKETASVAEVLRLNGYSTSAFGKWHNTPNWEISPAGPFDHWPTGLGFEYFYGFLGGNASHWEPALFRNTLAVDVPVRPSQGYHLTTDLVNDAIRWLHDHNAVAPSRPYFMYFATGAVHNPHHVPKEWIAKSRGRYDQGWDKFREEVFERQKKLGIIPADALLTPRPPGLPAWDSLGADQKKLYARQMEIYSAYLEQTDHEVGRLIDEVRRAPDGNNTMVLYMVGDNGGSAEGTVDGSAVGSWAIASRFKEGPETLLRYADDLGGPNHDNHYAAAWAWATSTPFQWMKQVASHFGGTRNPLIVSWPGRVGAPERVRRQFGHVNDIVPTIYEAAGISPPDIVNGAAQKPLEGKSLLATFTDPQAQEKHLTQYFEMFGNRAIYKDGWMASAKRDYEPWNIYVQELRVLNPTFEKDRWELYEVSKDFSQAKDLAATNPEKLAELKAEFDREARRNDVYPLVPIPQFPLTLVAKRKAFRLAGDVSRLPAEAIPDLAGRWHRIEADIAVPVGSVAGVIVALGGRTGGFSLYVRNGRLTYENNALGRIHQTIVADRELPQGQVRVAYEFTPEIGTASVPIGLHAETTVPGVGRLYIGSTQVAEGKLEKFGAYSRKESLDLGQDRASPVSNSYEAPFRYVGTIGEVRLDVR